MRKIRDIDSINDINNVFYSNHAENYIKYSSDYKNFPNLFLLINKFVKKLSGKKVLDVGFGSGRDSLYFSRKGLNVTAIDNVDYFINFLSQKDNKIRVIKSNMYKLCLNDKYDGIWVCGTFSHVPKEMAHKFIKSLELHLKDDGIIFISFKNDQDEQSLTKEQRYFELYSTNEITQIMQNSNLCIYEKHRHETKNGNIIWKNIFIKRCNI